MAGEEGCAGRGGVGRVAARALRPRRLDQGARASDGPVAHTIRAALRASGPPRYRRAAALSKLDPFKCEIHRLLRRDPRMPGQRIRELIAPFEPAWVPRR